MNQLPQNDRQTLFDALCEAERTIAEKDRQIAKMEESQRRAVEILPKALEHMQEQRETIRTMPRKLFFRYLTASILGMFLSAILQRYYWPIF